MQNSNDLIIVLGAIPSIDDEEICENLIEKSTKGTNVVLLSTMEDKELNSYLRLFCKYEAGSEEGLIAILAKYLLQDKNIPSKLREYFDDLDEGYLSAETNIGEEEFEDLQELYKKAQAPLLIIGRDLLLHPRKENIKRFLSILKKYADLNFFSFQAMDLSGKIETPSEIEELKSFDGTVVFNCKASNEDELNLLIGSRQFSIAAKAQNNQEIVVSFGGVRQNRKFVIDEDLKGTIALMPMIEGDTSSYRYKMAKITKREVS
jgi:NADH-quinone oxidoreductase subunit F